MAGKRVHSRKRTFHDNSFTAVANACHEARIGEFTVARKRWSRQKGEDHNYENIIPSVESSRVYQNYSAGRGGSGVGCASSCPGIEAHSYRHHWLRQCVELVFTGVDEMSVCRGREFV